MAFLNRVGTLLKQNVSKHVTSGFSASNASLFQAVRSMSTSSKVFVGGLSYSTDEMSLREAFAQYGEVIEARVIMDRETGRSRGFAFVTYASSESASSAIQAFDGQDLHGRRIKVNYATERPPRGGGFGGGGYGGGGGGFNYGGQGGNYGRGGGYQGGGGGYGGDGDYGGSGGYGGGDGGYGGSSGYQGGYQSGGGGFGNSPYPTGGGVGFGGQDNYPGGASGNNFPGGGYAGDGNYAGQTGFTQEENNNDLAGDENGRDGYGNEEEGNYANTGR